VRGLAWGIAERALDQPRDDLGLDQRPPKPARQSELLPTHPNIRGSRYYH